MKKRQKAKDKKSQNQPVSIDISDNKRLMKYLLVETKVSNMLAALNPGQRGAANAALCRTCNEPIVGDKIHHKYKSICKECVAISKMDHERKKHIVVKRMYYHQTANSKKRGHPPQDYSAEWFEKWIADNAEVYDELYDAWKKSGYTRWLKPSIDRIDMLLPYTKTNIELVTWGENHKRAALDHLSGKNNSDTKKVYQYDKDNGELLNVFHSQAEAARMTPGADQRAISAVCGTRRKVHTHAGYKWSFS